MVRFYARLGNRTVLAAGLIFLAAVAAVLYLLAGNTGLLVAVLLGQFPALAAILLTRRQEQHDAEQREHRLDQRLDRQDAQLAAIRTNVNKRGEEIKRRIERIDGLLKGYDKLQQRRFTQIDVLIGLYYDIRPESAIPATGGWAASADLLRYLYDQVSQGNRSRILECGSGVSTLIMAYALREQGHGQIIALDHDQKFAEQTQGLLATHGLDKWAQVRYAPLHPLRLDGEEWPWYDTSALGDDGPFDLVLVDGPPKATRDQARYPAVPMLYDRLAAEGMVVLDDYQRDGERKAGARWLERFPQLKAERLKHEKETLVLRLQAELPR